MPMAEGTARPAPGLVMCLAVRMFTGTHFIKVAAISISLNLNRVETPTLLFDAEETLQKGFRSIKSFVRHGCCCG